MATPATSQSPRTELEIFWAVMEDLSINQIFLLFCKWILRSNLVPKETVVTDPADSVESNQSLRQYKLYLSLEVVGWTGSAVHESSFLVGSRKFRPDVTLGSSINTNYLHPQVRVRHCIDQNFLWSGIERPHCQ